MLKIKTEDFTEEESAEINALCEWLRERGLSTGQAINLLNNTKSVIVDARHAEANKIIL